MSEDEQNEDENFLSRWSQRKREAKREVAGVAAAKPFEETEAQSEATDEGVAEKSFDLSSLPKLEDITGATDIKAFLDKGVPEGLRNAALRKAWASDPAIRNYVNPALDYAYDWNTPGGVPGNSELAPGTDIAKMVLQIMGGGDAETPAPQSSGDSSRSASAALASDDPGINAPQDAQALEPAQELTLPEFQSGPIPVSAEDENPKQAQVESLRAMTSTEFNAPQQQVRRHGTAKPRI